MDGGQGLLVVGRGAAHSNTQERRGKSLDSLRDYRKSTGERGARETEEIGGGTEDRRRNLGLPSVAPSLL